MISLLNAAQHLFFESGMKFIYLDNGHDGAEPMFPDPIVAAKDAETFEAIHVLMCAATGADPAYISTRRVADWLSEGWQHAAPKAKAAHA